MTFEERDSFQEKFDIAYRAAYDRGIELGRKAARRAILWTLAITPFAFAGGWYGAEWLVG